MTRRLFKGSTLPMTDVEHRIFTEAQEAHRAKCISKGRSHADADRLALSAGERAVKRSRGRVMSAKERTLPLFA